MRSWSTVSHCIIDVSFGFFEPLFLVHVLDEISGDAYDIVGA